MPLFKKKKKEDPVRTAKKAEFSGKAKEALQEKDTAPSQIEQETTQPVKKNQTDWYTDMKERSERAREYSNRFAFTEESLSSVYSIKKLDKIRQASNVKFYEMSLLEEGTVNCHERMMEDTGNEEKKAEAQEYYESAMSRIDTAKRLYSELLTSVEKRKEEIEKDPKLAKKNSLIDRFRTMRKDKPMLQLIRRVRLFEDNPGYQEKADGFFGKMKEELTSLSESLLSDEDKESLKTGMEAKEQAGEIRENVEEVAKAISDAKDESEPMDGVFGMMKDAAMLVKDAIFFIKDLNKSSSENILDKFVGIVTKGASILASAAGKIAELLSTFPFIGAIIGLIKNGITFFSEGYKFVMSQRRISKLRKQKKLLKERMLKRKKKYANDPELKGLYSFVGEDKSGAVKLDAKKLGKREKRGLIGGGSDARDTMRQAADSKKDGGKHLYYMAKEAESVEQYDELKEVIYKNKNKKKDATIALAQQGVDVAANIAKFFPGTGDIVSASIKLGNSIVSGGKFVGSKAFEYGKSIFGHARSKENKKVFRNKYAEHIYDNMAEVSGYLDGEGQIDLNKADPGSIRKAAESYDYAENMLVGMGADMPELIGAPSKEKLIEAMAEAFGAGK